MNQGGEPHAGGPPGHALESGKQGNGPSFAKKGQNRAGCAFFQEVTQRFVLQASKNERAAFQVHVAGRKVAARQYVAARQQDRWRETSGAVDGKGLLERNGFAQEGCSAERGNPLNVNPIGIRSKAPVKAVCNWVLSKSGNLHTGGYVKLPGCQEDMNEMFQRDSDKVEAVRTERQGLQACLPQIGQDAESLFLCGSPVAVAHEGGADIAVSCLPDQGSDCRGVQHGFTAVENNLPDAGLMSLLHIGFSSMVFHGGCSSRTASVDAMSAPEIALK